MIKGNSFSEKAKNYSLRAYKTFSRSCLQILGVACAELSYLLLAHIKIFLMTVLLDCVVYMPEKALSTTCI